MFSRSLYLSASLLLLFPALAQAQETISVTLISVEGRSDINADTEFSAQPISSAECLADIDITVDFRSIDNTATLIDVWRGTGNDCSDATQRSGDTATCTSLSELNFNVNGSTDITGQSYSVGSLVPCEDGEHTIYFLAAESAMFTGDVTSYGSFTIQVDITPPSAPTNLSANDGENSITLTWDATADTDVDHFELYYELGGCSSSALGMSENSEVPAGTLTVDTNVGSSLSTYMVTPDDVGLEVGGEITLGLVAVDDAYNRSVLSIACATRVTTDGFCDVYAAQTGQSCPQDCTVGAPGLPTSKGGAGLVFLVIAAASIIRRRR